MQAPTGHYHTFAQHGSSNILCLLKQASPIVAMITKKGIIRK